MKKCKICGREFEPMYPNSKYCSSSCRDLARMNKLRSWKIKHPGYMKMKQREYRHKKAIEDEFII